jgi:hypothetical protein
VVEFSGRFTVRSKDSDGGLIVATMTGPVDLESAGQTRAQIFQDWKNGTVGINGPGQNQQTVKLLLAASFDSTRPAENWAPQRFVKQGEGFWKNERLTRSQFVAVGEAICARQRFSPVRQVRLKVYELRP